MNMLSKDVEDARMPVYWVLAKGAWGDGWRPFFREELGLVKLKLLTGSFRCAVNTQAIIMPSTELIWFPSIIVYKSKQELHTTPSYSCSWSYSSDIFDVSSLFYSLNLCFPVCFFSPLCLFFSFFAPFYFCFLGPDTLRAQDKHLRGLLSGQVKHFVARKNISAVWNYCGWNCRTSRWHGSEETTQIFYTNTKYQEM